MLIIDENKQTLETILFRNKAIHPPTSLVESLRDKLDIFFSVFSRHLKTLKVNHKLKILSHRNIELLHFLEVELEDGVVYFDLHGKHVDLNSILNRYGLDSYLSSQYTIVESEIPMTSKELEDYLYGEEALFHYISG